MNFSYVNSLLKHNKIGKLIKYIEDNVFDFSIDDMNKFEETICDQSIHYYTLSYYINEINIRNDIKHSINDYDLYVDYLFIDQYELDMFRYILTNNVNDIFRNYDMCDMLECISFVYDNLELVKYLVSKELSNRYPILSLYNNYADDNMTVETYNSLPYFNINMKKQIKLRKLLNYYFQPKNLNMYNIENIDIERTLENNRKKSYYIKMIHEIGLYDNYTYNMCDNYTCRYV